MPSTEIFRTQRVVARQRGHVQTRELGSVIDIDQLSDLVLVQFDAEERPRLVAADKLTPLAVRK